MAVETFEILRACRRSRIKTRVLHALYTNRELLIAELADIASTTPARAFRTLRGDGKEFSADNGLLTLNVAVIRRTPRGKVVAITPHGSRAWRAIRRRLPRGSLRADLR